MTTFETTAERSELKPVSGTVRGARLVFYVITALLIGGVVLQIFFAGATLLVDPSYLEMHRAFAHVLEGLAILLPMTALVARLPGRMTLLSLVPFVLIGTQYFYVFTLPKMGLPLWTRGLHVVNALVIYWLMLRLSRTAWSLWRSSSS